MVIIWQSRVIGTQRKYEGYFGDPGINMRYGLQYCSCPELVFERHVKNVDCIDAVAQTFPDRLLTKTSQISELRQSK